MVVLGGGRFLMSEIPCVAVSDAAVREAGGADFSFFFIALKHRVE